MGKFVIPSLVDNCYQSRISPESLVLRQLEYLLTSRSEGSEHQEGSENKSASDIGFSLTRYTL